MVYDSGVYGPGTVVAGKYRIERVLGEGGMGVVFAATHIHLGTPVALKFLHQEMTHQSTVVERFMREARASAQLRGENVCRVSDVGVADNGPPFIVMELLTGQDLGTVMGHNGAMPLATAVEIVLQACLALGEAHAHGIVHRDLKPANLFWTQRPDGSACIKVLDFGVARTPEDVNFSLTQTSNMIGSPGYMSPEQLKSSRAVDARSDIWSLGVVLYEMTSGRKPFLGESITELALKVTLDPLPSLGGVVPEAFELVVARCLEKDPARRFQNVAELAAALAPFIGARGTELAFGVARVLHGAQAPMPAVPAITQTPTTLRGATGSITANAGPTRSWRLVLVMSLGALAGVIIAIVMVNGRREHAASAPAETKKMDVARPMPIAPATPDPKPADPKAAVDAKSAVATKPDAKPVVGTKPDAATAETKPDDKPKHEHHHHHTSPAPTTPPTTTPPGDVGDSRF